MTYPVFAASDILLASDMNAVGLWKISETSLTSVTNSISNVFSSTYDSYRVVISNLQNASSTTRNVTLRFRTGSDDTGANYFSGNYFLYGTNAAGNSHATGQTAANLVAVGLGANNGGGLSFDVINPNLAKATVFHGTRYSYQNDVSAYVFTAFGGGVNTATQYTGFSIIGVTDNLSGTVRVYGYRN